MQRGLTYKCTGCGIPKDQGYYATKDLMKKKRRLVAKKGRRPRCIQCREHRVLIQAQATALDWKDAHKEMTVTEYCQYLARNRHLKPWIGASTKGVVLDSGVNGPVTANKRQFEWAAIERRTNSWETFFIARGDAENGGEPPLEWASKF